MNEKELWLEARVKAKRKIKYVEEEISSYIFQLTVYGDFFSTGQSRLNRTQEKLEKYQAWYDEMEYLYGD